MSITTGTLVKMTVGEFYSVPCFVLLENGKPTNKIIPLIDFLHDDPKSGQHIPHYHMDARFFTNDTDLKIFSKENHYEMLEYSGNIYFDNGKYVIDETKFGQLVYIELKNLRADLTADSVFQGYCAVNHRRNKCPHLGFDLTDVPTDQNGVRTCPMHGLKIKGCMV